MAAQKKYWHGTRSGYQYHKCRCSECGGWQNARMGRYRARRAAAGKPLPNGWGPYNTRREPLAGTR